MRGIKDKDFTKQKPDSSNPVTFRSSAHKATSYILPTETSQAMPPLQVFKSQNILDLGKGIKNTEMQETKSQYVNLLLVTHRSCKYWQNVLFCQLRHHKQYLQVFKSQSILDREYKNKLNMLTETQYVNLFQ